MKYFEVETKCGHVGRMNCIFVKFAVIAENGKEAAKKARQFGRVKHDHKDAIRNVKEIALEDYEILLQNNKDDEYLHCNSRHEQSQIEDLYLRIRDDEYNVARYSKVKNRNVDFKIRKIRLQERISKKIICNVNREFAIEIA